MARILIIDDDRMVRETLKIIAEASGHEVHLASDGRQGLKIFATTRPDLVITDILMPEKEGIETITELRQAQPDIPIVAISGGGRIGNMDFLKLAQTFGANRTISKPFEPEDIIQTIDELTSPKPVARSASR